MRIQVRRSALSRGVMRGRGIVKGAVSRARNVRRVMRRAAERFRIRDVRLSRICVVVIINARVRTGGRQMRVLRAVIRIERR